MIHMLRLHNHCCLKRTQLKVNFRLVNDLAKSQILHLLIRNLSNALFLDIANCKLEKGRHGEDQFLAIKSQISRKFFNRIGELCLAFQCSFKYGLQQKLMYFFWRIHGAQLGNRCTTLSSSASSVHKKY